MPTPSGDLQKQIDACQRAIAQNPDDAESYWNLGFLLNGLAAQDHAEPVFRELIRRQPASPLGHVGLGYTLFRQGKIELAFGSLEHGINLDRSRMINSSLLVYIAQYHPALGPRHLHLLATQWADRHGALGLAQVAAHLNERSPTRKLKIGYVSPDLKNHVMGHLLAPILERHDRRKFELHCFASVAEPDDFSETLKACVDRWHDVSRMSDAELAALVRAEQIDILVDLAVHTAGNRLVAFSLKPAPVQASFLAYFGTTGLKQIDYVLCDRFLFSGESDGEFYSEKRLDLAGAYWCYRPNPLSPKAGPLPALANGFVTFGYLHSHVKVIGAVLSLWAKILREVPRSRMLMLVSENAARQRISQSMQHNGINPARLVFMSRQPHLEYLRLHQQIDIMLDPFPHGGGNTTCDALWMGTPVITLVGQTGVSRAGFSVLSHVGLESLCAQSHDQYFQLAINLAADMPRLSELRSTLRDRLQQSPIMDEPGYVAGIEEAFQSMWDRWCAT